MLHRLAGYRPVDAEPLPGTPAVDESRYDRARERALAADSWVGAALEECAPRADAASPEPRLGEAVEDGGASITPS